MTINKQVLKSITVILKSDFKLSYSKAAIC